MRVIERYRGSLLGLAVGDALGAAVEFQARGTFEPLTGMVGGGPFDLEAGQWTDDTSMALCLGCSLLEHEGFDPVDQMNRYLRWYREGYFSSTGECFDIGNTIAGALRIYEKTSHPYCGSTDPLSAGNGSLMRLAPVPMVYREDERMVAYYSSESSRTTHSAQEAVQACKLFGVMLSKALQGETKDAILGVRWEMTGDETELSSAILSLANREYQDKTRPEILSSGYVVTSLEAALWCFSHSDSFQEAVLLSANLGGDADTTSAICGQLAGAHYGMQNIPADWLQVLAMRDKIQMMADELWELSKRIYIQ